MGLHGEGVGGTHLASAGVRRGVHAGVRSGLLLSAASASESFSASRHSKSRGSKAKTGPLRGLSSESTRVELPPLLLLRHRRSPQLPKVTDVGLAKRATA